MNMTENIGSLAKKGIMWTGVFNALQILIRFVTSIILARLLFPEDFGLMGVAMIVVQFSRRIANYGFGEALIQRKDLDQIHLDTVFIFNLVVMGSFTTVLFFSSSYIASFFNNNQALGPVLAAMSFTFLLKALISVPQAILSRSMQFKEFEIARTIGSAMMLIAPIPFAIADFGVWALVIGYLLGNFSETLITTWKARWIPHFHFRLQAFKDLFSFGIWSSANTFIQYLINNVDYFLIAKFLGTAQLGFYERAFNLMNMPRRKITRRINKVLFSAYSRIQEDPERVVNGLLRVITYISFISLPLMVWLFFVAPSFITVLYGEKWTNTILPLQIMTLSGLIYVLVMTFNPVLNAMALVAQRARRQFVYFLILAGSILAGIQWGIIGVAWGVVFASLIYLALMLHLLCKHLPFTLGEFFRAQKSVLIYTLVQVLVLVIAGYLTRPYFSSDSWQMLLLVSVLSVFTFFGMHLIFRFKDIDGIFQEIMGEVRKLGRKIPVINHWKVFQKKKLGEVHE